MTGIAPSPPEPTNGQWFKSSYSGGEGNECVEVADRGPRVAIRDSKAPRKTLTFSTPVFVAFVEGLSNAHR
ncbi:DUF397 domain-containing protein [Streptomyces sp. NRRL F-5650]|jgi:hypothetical protein|uniref:DUF397 domain-containing protein n=1 Tax=Streptomyces sp. NRRL F-5650 TaxID=1463868 RepID=UPI00068C496C|nr:DUF397 domain-containing protein [Streptomyces sp. NRRL F-5650]